MRMQRKHALTIWVPVSQMPVHERRNLGRIHLMAGEAFIRTDAAGVLRAAVGTGMKVEAAHRHHKAIPNPKPGEHLWTAIAMYRVQPNADQIHLDTENLLTIEGPGCFICERPYSAALAAKPCTGEPR